MRNLLLSIGLVAIVAHSGSPASAQRLNVVRHGAFEVIPQTDPITDLDKTFVFLRPEDDGVASLALGCSGAALWMQVMSDIEFFGGASALMVYRFDQDRPDTALILRGRGRSTSGKHFYLVMREDQNRIAARMRTARRLVMRVRGAGSETTEDVFFSLAQSSTALARARCSAALMPVQSADPQIQARLGAEAELVNDLPAVREARQEEASATISWKRAEEITHTAVVVVEGGGAYYALRCGMGQTLLGQAKEGLSGLRFFETAAAAERAGYRGSSDCPSRNR